MWRKLWHPGYGNYGGAKQRCRSNKQESCPLPIDGLDEIYRQHDIELRRADGDKRDRKLADKRLAKRLWQYEGSYKRPVYGRLYRFFSFIVFKLVSA